MLIVKGEYGILPMYIIEKSKIKMQIFIDFGIFWKVASVQQKLHQISKNSDHLILDKIRQK